MFSAHILVRSIIENNFNFFFFLNNINTNQSVEIKCHINDFNVIHENFYINVFDPSSINETLISPHKVYMK